MGAFKDRRICGGSQPSIKKVLELTRGSSSRSTRCVDTNLDKERNLFKSTIEVVSEGNQENQTTESLPGSANDFFLVKPVLVSHGTEDTTSGLSNNHENLKQILPSRMAIISEARRESNQPNEDSIEFIKKVYQIIYYENLQSWLGPLCEMVQETKSYSKS